jgi:hypothetical protein
MRRALFLVCALAGCDAAAVTGGDASIDARASDVAAMDAPARDAPADDTARDAGPLDVDAADPAGSWRSAFFPRGWVPVHAGGSPDAQGRFLPDFSYAGWHFGEQRPPVGAALGTVHEVDGALGDGSTEATAGIQAAIDATCSGGGGIVHLPAGTFLVRVPAGATTVLSVGCSHLVLRGEGPSTTRILFDDPHRARGVAVIGVRGPGSIYDSASTTTWMLAEDLPVETRTFTLASDPGFAVGDTLVVRNDDTDGFRAEHRMDDATSGEVGLWPFGSGGFRGIFYVRTVTGISGREITVDAPLRYPLRTRDLARVYRAPTLLTDVGLEAFSIGMTENLTTIGGAEDTHDDDYTVMGTTGYEVHSSSAITLDRVRDAWIWDVDSFAPAGNTTGAHVLSNGIVLSTGATRVTLSQCDFGRAQYRGGGGNGYLFQLLGNDTLLRDDTATNARHGFIINYASSGNVFRDDAIHSSRLTDDSHRFLAHANLYDRMVLDVAWMSAVNRGTTSTGAGFTATQHVFWGTQMDAIHPTARGCAIESAQFGWGYLIGSSGVTGAMPMLCPMSFTNSYWASLDPGDPTDVVEGEGMAATLFPHSLHQAMLDLRCARDGIDCTW